MKKPTVIYAGRLERFFAYLLDTLILLIAAMFLIRGFGAGGGMMLITFVGEAAYYTLFSASNWQASPGQRLLSIRVVRLDGKAIDYSAALQRFILYALPRLPMYSSLFSADTAQSLTGIFTIFWFAPILFTFDRAGMHDTLSKMRLVVGRSDDMGKA